MYNIEFYRTEKGECDIEDFLEDLRKRSPRDKSAKVLFKRVSLQLSMLSNNGTRISDKMCKHISEDIWELRPGDNRILFFYWTNNTFVLLHHFIKKTQETPVREIEKAKRERKDYLRQKRGGK